MYGCMYVCMSGEGKESERGEKRERKRRKKESVSPSPRFTLQFQRFERFHCLMGEAKGTLRIRFAAQSGMVPAEAEMRRLVPDYLVIHLEASVILLRILLHSVDIRHSLYFYEDTPRVYLNQQVETRKVREGQPVLGRSLSRVRRGEFGLPKSRRLLQGIGRGS
ncbi:hypothetical protein BDV30DRAFT_105928 [Aspergillus minisclerotigenes]|uniref:Uncharacterized protein n=1 Tax=Aspergillus minisclerotigenes TaxID=656917 RepID=A0A5N6J5R5_9EURO|nr:hypothetical protein BDV30DRAFT_105928 [Aspergillus minisclerotigenes]